MYDAVEIVDICRQNDEPIGFILIKVDTVSGATFNSNLIFVFNLCYVAGLCDSEGFHAIIVIVNDLNKEHSIPEVELNVTWMQFIDFNGCILDTCEASRYFKTEILNELGVEFLLQKLAPKQKGSL